MLSIINVTFTSKRRLVTLWNYIVEGEEVVLIENVNDVYVKVYDVTLLWSWGNDDCNNINLLYELNKLLKLKLF